MHPELFHIPGLDLPIYSYGLLMVIGFLAASYLGRYLANKAGLDGEAFINAALIALVAGIAGARISHILENPREFFGSGMSAWDSIKAMANLSSGGLTYYGGFLLAFPILILYGYWKKLPLALSMDICAPCVMVGLAFGRIGCLMNGCCHGAVCDPNQVPWAITFPYRSNAYIDHYDNQATRQQLINDGKLPAEFLEERPLGAPHLKTHAEIARESAANPSYPSLSTARSLPVHPAQIYSAITAFLLAALLLAYYATPHIAGRVFALMLVLEGASRFLLELLRTEPTRVGSFTLSMILGLALVALGILLWFLFGRFSRPVMPILAPTAATPSPA